MRGVAPESALRRLSGRLLPFAGLALISTALALSTDRFLTLANLLDVGRRVSVINIIALGMTFVIVTGGIDLSVGSVVALAGVAGARRPHPRGPLPGGGAVGGRRGAPGGGVAGAGLRAPAHAPPRAPPRQTE